MSIRLKIEAGIYDLDLNAIRSNDELIEEMVGTAVLINWKPVHCIARIRAHAPGDVEVTQFTTPEWESFDDQATILQHEGQRVRLEICRTKPRRHAAEESWVRTGLVRIQKRIDPVTRLGHLVMTLAPDELAGSI